MSGLDWINTALAVLGALIAFGAINRMGIDTERPVIAAFVTVMVGLAGYAFSEVMSAHWQKVFDTLLIGGTCALLIGTRKQTIWIAPTWMPRLSATVSLTTWVLFFGLVA